MEEVDERLLAKFSYLACGDVSPLQAVVGSIAAQEVVKVSKSATLCISNNIYDVHVKYAELHSMFKVSILYM